MKSIFIVDDCKLHNILMKKMLDDSGYEVHTFTDGYSLLDILDKKKPHLIISDIDMPEINGFELCEKIKSQSLNKDIPLIYVSSLEEEKVHEQARENGAVGFLQKPLKKEPFLEVVAQKV